jgi:hypothetical protein
VSTGFLDREDLPGTSLLWPPLCSTVTSSSFTPPRCTSTSLPTPAPTTSSAPHRRETLPKKHHCEQLTRVSPLLSVTPKSERRLTDVLLGLPHTPSRLWSLDWPATAAPHRGALCSPILRMVSIIGDRARQLGENGEYWMGRRMSSLI